MDKMLQVIQTAKNTDDRSDQSKVVVVMNESAEEKGFILETEAGIIELSIPAHKIQTLIY